MTTLWLLKYVNITALLRHFSVNKKLFCFALSVLLSLVEIVGSKLINAPKNSTMGKRIKKGNKEIGKADIVTRIG